MKEGIRGNNAIKGILVGKKGEFGLIISLVLH